MAQLKFRNKDSQSAKKVTRRRARNHKIIFWISLAINYGLLLQIYFNK